MDPKRPVPHDVLMGLLEDAQWAPTRLGAGLQSVYDAITPEDKRNEGKREKLVVNTRTAPVVMAVVAKVVLGGKGPEWEELAAIACAVQNLMLSAHEHGLGAY